MVDVPPLWAASASRCAMACLLQNVVGSSLASDLQQDPPLA